MRDQNISVVSVTYRSLPDTKDFVESVLDNTRQPYEFILCANGVEDSGLQDYLRRLEEKGYVRLLWNPKNIGVRAFGQVMRLASADYIFRCDSDVLVHDPYWTDRMVEQHRVSQSEIGSVAAVGTANTRGHQIRRTPRTTETDMIMSNCMAIHKPTVQAISQKLRARYPEMLQEAERLLVGGQGYPGFHDDLRSTLEYARLGGWWWDTNFGGRSEPLGYGSDDMWWSILARWSGLRLVTSQAGVAHKDASARPGYEAERHRLVARGFQYLRTFLSLAAGWWDDAVWQGLPHNLPALVEYRNSGQPTAA